MSVQVRGARGLQPPESIFGQKLNFSGRSQQPKMTKKFVPIKRKNAFIPSSEMNCPKSGIFANNYWVG